jgi:hypothetical protein
MASFSLFHFSMHRQRQQSPADSGVPRLGFATNGRRTNNKASLDSFTAGILTWPIAEAANDAVGRASRSLGTDILTTSCD